ncbi:Uncharacterised protein [Kluyvera cryocrescens]|uniref:Uncharacterized protein n=1 Tax=Kluyvera cryocrescens TaxID=580 RepID=A0A485CI36_KLUCR|nr:Uncharacterised protein [Kluyvera cryocrescens]
MSIVLSLFFIHRVDATGPVISKECFTGEFWGEMLQKNLLVPTVNFYCIPRTPPMTMKLSTLALAISAVIPAAYAATADDTTTKKNQTETMVVQGVTSGDFTPRR